MISFANVTVRYPRAEADTLHGVSLEAERGRITALVGPNGSGKSTLVRAMLRRIPMMTGTIAIDNVDITPYLSKPTPTPPTPANTPTPSPQRQAAE